MFMKRVILISIFLLFNQVIFAHGSNSHQTNSGPLSSKQVLTQANKSLQAAINSGRINKSWGKQNVVSKITQEPTAKNSNWEVQFTKKSKTNQSLYITLFKNGDYKSMRFSNDS